MNTAAAVIAVSVCLSSGWMFINPPLQTATTIARGLQLVSTRLNGGFVVILLAALVQALCSGVQVRLPMRSEWPIVFVLGTAGIALNEVFYYIGTIASSTALAGGYQALVPLITFALAHFFRYEVFSLHVFFCIALVAMGTILVSI